MTQKKNTETQQHKLYDETSARHVDTECLIYML